MIEIVLWQCDREKSVRLITPQSQGRRGGAQFVKIMNNFGLKIKILLRQALKFIFIGNVTRISYRIFDNKK